MLFFPNCKINLGLNVIEKRSDGFHNIETVFYPIDWQDALEVVESRDLINIVTTGMGVEGKQEDNIIFKAWKLINASKKIPGITVYLHKVIPMGAGLGGGSSDAAHFLRLMNEKFNLNFTADELRGFASQLGSDCAFFLENKPVLGTGKGDQFVYAPVDLSKYYILVVYPDVSSNTKEAYDGITPHKSERCLMEIIQHEPVKNWKNCLNNDFEKSIFKKYPEIERLKAQLYENGAVYASMSGSGSAVFGLFEKKPLPELPLGYQWHLQLPRI